MQKLHDSEWLDTAQRLSVGRQARLEHHCGNGTALVVYNNADSWSAWCWRCHSHGYKAKQHVVLQQDTNKSTRSNAPEDLQSILEAPRYLQDRVLSFLLSKGIDPNQMPLQDVFISVSESRVVFRTPQGYLLGRILYETKSVPKWRAYFKQGKVASSARLHGADDKVVVLVEDLLSAYKVHYCTGLTTVAVLGTHVDIMAALPAENCVVFLDGDQAGADGAARWAKNLGFYGVGYVNLHCLTREQDPKDLTEEELRICIQKAVAMF